MSYHSVFSNIEYFRRATFKVIVLKHKQSILGNNNSKTISISNG